MFLQAQSCSDTHASLRHGIIVDEFQAHQHGDHITEEYAAQMWSNISGCVEQFFK